MSGENLAAIGAKPIRGGSEVAFGAKPIAALHVQRLQLRLSFCGTVFGLFPER
jgi:hypothetical protein